ncbi:transcriptional regulator with XRE-family HTH domain [Xanthomonas arboricola]|uniref:helix-turn-helix domain-containing protein n=1 Tax=Xanthomonas cannabis TaxID=1885674 RepID=UPI001615A45A|nr:helix-turn-helix transcriptional regulator [Xanthomonas cannabis]MBB3800634.1 transcriptional regulator with XRE-family HTH domain [Xanthomonas cannabis]
MNTTESKSQSRLLTPEELASCVRTFRELRHWSQEQLAEISHLNVRTVQRVEKGEAASFDTRRALASAFDFEDIDALNKPFHIPTTEELKVAQEKFGSENVTLTALPLTSGRHLAKLAENCSMDLSEPAFDLPREAAEEFAALVDYFRDYRDCADAYSETQKFDIYDELQAHIDTLQAQGVSLRYAERKTQVRWGSDQPDATPVPVTALYVMAFPLGKEPKQFATPKTGRIGF